MRKIVTVVGARPQFIKAAMVFRAIAARNSRIPGLPALAEILVHTGQHYDANMSEVFFQELRLPQPDYFLGIGSGGHGEQTGRMLIELEKVLLAEQPDMVMVYGDTNSTLAGALAASKLHIPVAHVEAGLRSYNSRMPEEINRILTDHVASILFCPTETAVRNLVHEGFTNVASEGRLIDLDHTPSAPRYPLILNVGDVMLDLALLMHKSVDHDAVLNKFRLKAKDYILVTIHRAENTDIKENLENIFEALSEVARKGIKVLFPLHPRTRNAIKASSRTLDEFADMDFIEPVGYAEMVVLESNAKLIVTDSGGVQKEGYFYKTPCVIPRLETEWVELVDSGWAKLAGTDKERIGAAISGSLESDGPVAGQEYFGDANAAERVCGILTAFCSTIGMQ